MLLFYSSHIVCYCRKNPWGKGHNLWSYKLCTNENWTKLCSAGIILNGVFLKAGILVPDIIMHNLFIWHLSKLLLNKTLFYLWDFLPTGNRYREESGRKQKRVGFRTWTEPIHVNTKSSAHSLNTSMQCIIANHENCPVMFCAGKVPGENVKS